MSSAFALALACLHQPAVVTAEPTSLSHPPMRTAKSWVLYQEDRVGGTRIIYLSSKGIRIETKLDQTVIVSKAPDWNVVTYCDRTKSYFSCPAANFVNNLSRPIAVAYGINLAVLPLKATESGTKYGVAIMNYEQKFQYDHKFWNRDVKASDARRLPLTANAIFSDEVKVPPQEASVLVRLYNIPSLTGVPLAFSYRDQDRDYHWHVRTFSVKPADVSISNLAPPAAYKRVARSADVTRGVESDEALKNLF